MKRRLIALTAVVWLAVAILAAAFLYNEREKALQRAERDAEALTLQLEAHIARTFQAIDITLAGVADAIQLAPGLERHNFAFQKVLAERLQSLQPFVRAIFVIGPDGRIVQDTDFPKTPEVSLADRPYFEAHVKDPSVRQWISEPIRSRSDLGWFVAVTRRIGDLNFHGVAVAALVPQYFEAQFSRLALDNGSVVALYNRDGTLIARYPSRNDDIGKSFAAFQLFSLTARNGSGTYIHTDGVFSGKRLISYRGLEDRPLVVAMGLETEGILSTWRDMAVAVTLAVAALAALLMLLVVVLLRYARMRDQTRERLAQAEKLEALGHLTGGVSHDFANLLNVISASLRIVITERPGTARTRTALGAAERAILRGTQLIDRLRAFARRQPLQVHAADLNALVREGADLLRQVGGPAVRLEMALAADLRPCLLDETELEVALINLLVNARDAGAKNVELKTCNRGEHVCLELKDDGSGMSEEVRRRVFEPYFSTKGAAGTGLGLAQVYGFLRQVGGDVQIESRPARGTSVLLLFPGVPNAKRTPAPRRPTTV